MTIKALSILSLTLILPCIAWGQNSDFEGTVDNDWGNAANWSLGVVPQESDGAPGHHAVVNSATADYTTTQNSIHDLMIGSDHQGGDILGMNGSNGTVNLSAGTLTTNGWAFVGSHGKTGTLNISGNATFEQALVDEDPISPNRVARLYIGSTGDPDTGGIGVVNVSDNATLDWGDWLIIGSVGENTGNGTLNISGGTAFGNNINSTTTGTGLVNQTGGTVTTATWVSIGNDAGGFTGGTSTYDISGGTLEVGGALQVGERATGILNVSGTGTVNANNEGTFVARETDFADGTISITGSQATFNTSLLRIDAGNSVETHIAKMNWIADAGGISTIQSGFDTVIGDNALLTVDLTSVSTFSTFTNDASETFQDFTLISNTSAGMGNFVGLAEGGSIGVGGTINGKISYIGFGANNDIVVRVNTTDTGGLLGDANGDGNFDFGDIEAFFLALTDPGAYATQYPNVSISLLDMNADGNTDFGDIEAFFAAVTGA